MNFELEKISCEIRLYFKIFIGIILLLVTIPLIPQFHLYIYHINHSMKIWNN